METVAMTAVFVVITAFTFSANLILLLAFAFARQHSHTHTFALTLIVSMVTADLLIAVVVMPLASYWSVVGDWRRDDFVCRLYVSVDVMLCTASILHLTALSADRCLAVCRPLLHRQLTARRACSVCLVLWLTSALVEGMQQLGKTVTMTPEAPVQQTDNATSEACGGVETSQVYLLISISVAFILPLCFIIAFHVAVLVVVRRSASTVPTACPRAASDSTAPCRHKETQRLDKALAHRRPDSGCASADVSEAAVVNDDVCGVGNIRDRPYGDEKKEYKGDVESDVGTGAQASRKYQVVQLISKGDILGGESEEKETATESKFAESINLKEKDMKEISDCEKRAPANSKKYEVVKSDSDSEKSVSSEEEKDRGKKVENRSAPRAAVGVSWGGVKVAVGVSWGGARAAVGVPRGGARARRTVACLVLAFVVCWLPYFCVSLLEGLGGCRVDRALAITVLWLGYVNSSLNPVLLYSFNSTVNNAVRRLLRLRTPAGNGPSSGSETADAVRVCR